MLCGFTNSSEIDKSILLAVITLGILKLFIFATSNNEFAVEP